MKKCMWEKFSYDFPEIADKLTLDLRDANRADTHAFIRETPP